MYATQPLSVLMLNLPLMDDRVWSKHVNFALRLLFYMIYCDGVAIFC